MSKELIEQLAKEHGAIVHGDGNIFFTNHVKLEAFAKAYQAAAPIDNVAQFVGIDYTSDFIAEKQAEALEKAAKLVHESDRLNWLDATQLSKDIRSLIPPTGQKVNNGY
jgi:hypothetical protein